MKTLITTLFLLILSVSLFSQRPISYGYIKVNKAQYDSCRKIQYLTNNPQVKKQANRLIIPIAGKKPKVFADNSSDTDFKEYEYIGDIKGTKLSLVKRSDYNSEEFYLINRETGSVYTLIGQPVFASNMKDFACLNNHGTDEQQRIQICEIQNNTVVTRGYVKTKTDTFIDAINCVSRNTLFAKDKSDSFWKLSFQIVE